MRDNANTLERHALCMAAKLKRMEERAHKLVKYF